LFFYTQLGIWGNIYALAGSVIFLMTTLYPNYYIGGNFTETYALLPITLMIPVIHKYITTRNRWLISLIGILTACAFLLKPTYIGMGLASGFTIILLDWVSPNRSRLWKTIFTLTLSFLSPLLLVSLYWVFNNSFYEFIFALFLHNTSYIESSLSLRSLIATLRLYMIYQPLASLVCLALITCTSSIFANRGHIDLKQFFRKRVSSKEAADESSPTTEQWFILTLGISFLLDFLMIAISAKNFGHYFIIPIPTLAAIWIYLLSKLHCLKGQSNGNNYSYWLAFAAALFLTATWGVEVFSKEIPDKAFVRHFFTENVTTFRPNQIEQYILANSEPDQSVLIWGTHPSYNFTTRRRSPTKYIFLPHLFTPTPQASHGFDEFLAELEHDPPAVIAVDIESGVLPFFGAEGDSRCPNCSDELKFEMEKFNQYVERNYTLDHELPGWLFYRSKQGIRFQPSDSP